MMAMPRTVAIDRLELGIAPHRWPFAEARRAEIDAHFAVRRRAVPDLWNGRVLLMNDVAVAGGVVRGTFFETGFADFIAWRDWGFPDRSVVNCFAMAALRASDGAYLLGVMSTFTANPGRIYFPAGTPDPSDIRGTPSTSLATCCVNSRRRPVLGRRTSRPRRAGLRLSRVRVSP
jgi:hypothetical protein